MSPPTPATEAPICKSHPSLTYSSVTGAVHLSFQPTLMMARLELKFEQVCLYG